MTMNRPTFLFLTLLILVVSGTISGQNSKIDSLANLLKNHLADDSAKVNLLNKIANSYTKEQDKRKSYATQASELAEKIHFLKGKAESLSLIGLSYSKSDKALAIDYLQKAIKVSEEINDKVGMARYMNWMGITYKSYNENVKAIASFQKAIEIDTELNAKPELAKVLINLSALYRNEGNYGQAIDGYDRALKLYVALDNKNEVTNCLNSLGIIYSFQSNYSQALENFQKYLKYKEELNDKKGCATGLINVGNIYIAQEDYPNALELFQKALKLAEEVNSKSMIATCLGNMGTTCQKMNNKQAIVYLDRALTISESISDKSLTVSLLIFIGDYYRIAGEFEKALYNYRRTQTLAEEVGLKRQACEAISLTGAVYFKQRKYAAALNFTLKSLDIANEMKSMEFQREIHKQLSDIYASANDYKNALLHQKQYETFKDSIFNDKSVKKITELELTYKFDKEKQATELQHQKDEALHEAKSKQQTIVIFSLVIGFLMMLLLALFLYRSYRFKTKTNLILTKQKKEIEDLNEEYLAINEELLLSNEQLKLAKNLVEERENLLIQITDNVPVFISLIDNDMNYVFANNGYADNFSRQKKELLGKKVEEVLGANAYQRVHSNLTRTLAGETLLFENLIRRKDGEDRLLQTTYIPYFQKNNIEGVIVCSDDITARKAAEQAMKEIEAEKERLMALEIERIGMELDANKKSVTAATLKLLQNSERDTQTIDRLADIEKNADAVGKQKLSMLISDYKRLSYNSNWDEFEILFERVHSSFYEKLNSQFPTLTANDRKICAFLKLNMSSKEIAQITFQSDEALKKARLRLRQKLEIDRETNLVSFLQNI